MDKNVRRFTIYVPRDLSSRLTAIHQESYRNCGQQDMLRDLIARGLQESKKRSPEVIRYAGLCHFGTSFGQRKKHDCLIVLFSECSILSQGLAFAVTAWFFLFFCLGGYA